MPTYATMPPFTGADHLAMLLVTGGVLFAVIALGRSGCEPQVRRGLAAAGVLIWLASGLYYTLWPGQLKLEESLPIQACDLLALFAPLALVLDSRWLRAIAYFGAIGLTTQAFFTPVIDTGPATAKFWIFWLLHMSILVCAVFDLAVGGYRPSAKDLLRAVAFWLAYALGMIVLNTSTGWYYGYLSPEIPDNAQDSVLRHLGDWPVRPIVMIGIVTAIFVVLWLPFALRRKERG